MRRRPREGVATWSMPESGRRYWRRRRGRGSATPRRTPSNGITATGPISINSRPGVIRLRPGRESRHTLDYTFLYWTHYIVYTVFFTVIWPPPGAGMVHIFLHNIILDHITISGNKSLIYNYMYSYCLVGVWGRRHTHSSNHSPVNHSFAPSPLLTILSLIYRHLKQEQYSVIINNNNQ